MRFQIVQIATLLFLLSCLSCTQDVGENLSVGNLRCEMLTNPEGIDIKNPRLSWEIQGEERGILQEAYHILVASSPDKLTEDSADLWNSGRVVSDQSIQIKYEGKDLKSRQTCYWTVRIWANNGKSDWSEMFSWRMGLLHFKDWKGRWIGADRVFPGDREDSHSRLSARHFRKEFSVPKEIKKATIYIIGLGLYELSINGEKVGENVLAPLPTDYTKYVLYNTRDVTTMLNIGTNAIGVILGNGRYYTMRQNYKPYKIKNFGYPKLLLNLDIEYSDGSRETIRTDNTWKFTADGPIRSNNEYDGEVYDARKEMPGWNTVGYNDNQWLSAEYVQEPGGEYTSQLNKNMKVMETVLPKTISKISSDRYIIDMGQNIVGWIEMKVKGKKGDIVILKFAETLQENGELDTAPLRDAEATDSYILKGGEIEIWEPRFVYHGFRYVEINGYPGEPTIDDFMGKMIFDNIKTIGSFKTSNETINKIYNNAWWTIAGNYKGMMIDCPQRDERQPWLGDRAIGSYGESFVFDNIHLYTKMLEDIRLAQKNCGSLPDVAPPYYRYYSDNMTWPGTYILVAEMLYNQTANIDIIQKHYPAMKAWLEYMKDRYMTEEYILSKDSYGDWCMPPKTIEMARGKNANIKHPSVLISTAYYYHFMNIMMRFAELTGKRDDFTSFQELGQHIKSNFNNNFYNSNIQAYDTTLTNNILPHYFRLVPDDMRDQVFDHIVETIEVENNGHLSTGLVGVQWLMRCLTENGRPDLAYKIATNTTYPSWGYMVENEATTIWELWQGNVAGSGMNSKNHVMMLGDLIVWYYESLAGIKSDPEYPGFKRIIMKPSFVEGLDSVNASYYSIHGLIKSKWVKEDSKLNWDLTIPANTTAIIYLPGNDKDDIQEGKNKVALQEGIKYLGNKDGRYIFEIGSGEYSFTSIY